MRCRIISLLVVCLFVLHILPGCSTTEKNTKFVVEDEGNAFKFTANNFENGNLVENRSVYKNDKPDSIMHLYVTVLKENNISKGKIVTLTDLNSFDYLTHSESPKVEVIFQEGSPTGPQTGYFANGTSTANATMEVRGKSTTTAIQKSYKIRLYDKAGLWNNQRIINLNKHPRDFTRVRNKLSFDLFKIIPHITSLRTQFVNLHIKDLSDSKNNSRFIDYGLYTHIEQPNKTFLRNHGLDPNAHLYKTEYFEFFRYPEQLKLADDSAYKKSEFEKILSIEGNEDHSKLLGMLDDVNNYSLDINKVVDKHFNRENMLTWLAANLLTGNFDTISQNYFLYSPLNSNTWYFLPWDYDAAWGQYEQEGARIRNVAEWHFGLSNYWGVVLFNRFFKDPENLRALNEKIELLIKVINKERTQEFLSIYHDSVYKYIKSNPDMQYLPSRIENFAAEYKRLPEQPEKNRSIYYKNLEKPMPFFLGDPVFDSNKYMFYWDRSFDLQADSITYEFQLSTDPNFSKLLIKREGLIDNELSIQSTLEGIYYWRVIARDSKGNFQEAFDEYKDSQGNSYFGIKQFTAIKH